MEEINLLIISEELDKRDSIFSKEKNFRLDFDEVFSDVRKTFKTKLSMNDLVDIGKRILRYRTNRIKSTQRVYLALREIGKSAHYSEIAKILIQ